MYVWIYNKVSLIEVVHKVVDLLADHYTRVWSTTTTCCHVLVQRLALAVAMMIAMVILIYVI